MGRCRAHQPGTKALGRMAATTVSVARISGLPTSQASAATSWRPRVVARQIRCRTMISTSTMGSSTWMRWKISGRTV